MYVSLTVDHEEQASGRKEKGERRKERGGQGRKKVSSGCRSMFVQDVVL